MSTPRIRNDLRPLATAAVTQGWKIERTAQGHFWFIPPDPKQRKLLVGDKLGDPHAKRNNEARLRRAGLNV